MVEQADTRSSKDRAARRHAGSTPAAHTIWSEKRVFVSRPWLASLPGGTVHLVAAILVGSTWHRVAACRSETLLPDPRRVEGSRPCRQCVAFLRRHGLLG